MGLNRFEKLNQVSNVFHKQTWQRRVHHTDRYQENEANGGNWGSRNTAWRTMLRNNGEWRLIWEDWLARWTWLHQFQHILGCLYKYIKIWRLTTYFSVQLPTTNKTILNKVLELNATGTFSYVWIQLTDFDGNYSRIFYQVYEAN